MGQFSFHYVDLLVVVIVLASASFAVWRGFVRETLSIFSWAAAAFCTLYFANSAVPLLSGLLPPAIATIAAYVGVFLVVLIPLSFIGYRFASGVRDAPIGALDRSLGAVFGIVRGLVVLAICYIVLTLFIPVKRQPNWLVDAYSFPAIQDSSDALLSLMPSHDVAYIRNQEAAAPASAQAATPENQSAPEKKVSAAAPKNHDKKKQKTYGAKDRQALDRLIQATGNGDEKQP